MKLLRLRVKDFLGIAKADLDLSSPINLIQGTNASGKSSIRDAIEWALTGRCRGTDAGGRGAAALIRGGASETAVEVTLETQEGRRWQVLRMRDRVTGSFSVREAGEGPGLRESRLVEELAGAASEAIVITLDPLHFLSLDSRTQSSLLAGAVGVHLPRGEFLKSARDFGLSATALVTLEKFVLQERIDVTGMNEVHGMFYVERREAKKRLKEIHDEMLATPNPLLIGDVEETRLRVEKIRSIEIAAATELGRIQRQEFERSEMSARRKVLEDQLIELERRAKEKPQQELIPEGQSSIEELEQAIAEKEQICGELSRKVKEAEDQIARISAEFRTAQSGVESTKENDTACPAGITEDPCPILANQTGAPSKARIASLKREAKRLGLLLDEKGSELAKLRDELSAGLQEIRKLEIALARERAKVEHETGANEATWDAIQAELDRINEALLDDPSEKILKQENNLRELTEARRSAETEVSNIEIGIRQKAELDRLRERKEEAARQVDVLEELVATLDPKALPAKILASRIGPVEEGLNTVLRSMTAERYEIALEIDDNGVALRIKKSGVDHPLPTGLLSASERLRVGTAISAAFALITPLRILAVDEVDLLLEDPRALLKQTLLELAQPQGALETVLLLQSAPSPSRMAFPEVATFWVDSAGSVARLSDSEGV